MDFDDFFTNFNKNEEEPQSKDIPWIHRDTEEEEEAKEEAEAQGGAEGKESEREHEQQEQLSQKLSQLGTSNVEPPMVAAAGAAAAIGTSYKRPALTPTTPTTPTALGPSATIKKKFKPGELGNPVASTLTSVEEMPEYLWRTKNIFEPIVMPLLPPDATINRANLIEELREMAFLEHQLQIVHLDIELWTVYRRSGTAELQAEDNRSALQQLQCPLPPAPRIWPKRLKAAITADSSVNAQDKKTLNHTTCLNYVNKTLAQYDEQARSYQTRIEEKRKYLKGNITIEIEQSIADLVRDEGVALYRIVIEGFIAAVEFSYKDRVIELEFEHETSDRDQVFCLCSLVVLLSRHSCF